MSVARIDWRVIGIAGGAGLAIVVAGAALASVLGSGGDRWITVPTLVVVATGFASAGLVAGRRRRDTPILHGAAGAGVTFVGAVAVGLVVAAFGDRELDLAALPVAGAAALTAGVAGALVADELDRRRLRRREGR